MTKKSQMANPEQSQFIRSFPSGMAISVLEAVMQGMLQKDGMNGVRWHWMRNCVRAVMQSMFPEQRVSASMHGTWIGAGVPGDSATVSGKGILGDDVGCSSDDTMATATASTDPNKAIMMD